MVKLAAWIVTGSVALLSSAMDGLVDTAASVATFFGVRCAERPPDHDHRFGHGKGEAVAAFKWPLGSHAGQGRAGYRARAGRSATRLRAGRDCLHEWWQRSQQPLH